MVILDPYTVHNPGSKKQLSTTDHKVGLATGGGAGHLGKLPLKIIQGNMFRSYLASGVTQKSLLFVFLPNRQYIPTDVKCADKKPTGSR